MRASCERCGFARRSLEAVTVRRKDGKEFSISVCERCAESLREQELVVS